MDQIFIKVKTAKDKVVTVIHKDLMNADYRERMDYYTSISKGVLVHMLEEFIKDKAETNDR